MLAGTVALSGLAVSGCMATGQPGAGLTPPEAVRPNPYLTMYAALPNEQFPIPAVDLSQVENRYLRRMVDYETDETGRHRGRRYPNLLPLPRDGGRQGDALRRRPGAAGL